MNAGEELRLPPILAGRFEALGVVGHGGFGVVYRARQVDLGRLVAIKVLHPQYFAQEQLRERFESEARVVSRLSHPAVVPVLDFGLDADAAYIVFPYVDGGNLRARMDAGPLPWLEAVPHITAMLEALAYIHGEGVIHRDLKPENVLLENGTHALLTDFGISKPSGTTFHTGQGVVIGTPGYLPPEVMHGDPAAPQTDIYAAGVITWEMLCTRRPYELAGDVDPTSPRAILEELRQSRGGPPHGLPPGAEGLPPDIDRFFDRLLSPRLTERFGRAADALAGLAEIAEGHSQTKARMKRPPRARASTGGRTLVAARAPDKHTLIMRPPASSRSRAALLAAGSLLAALATGGATWLMVGGGSDAGGTLATPITTAFGSPEAGDPGMDAGLRPVPSLAALEAARGSPGSTPRIPDRQRDVPATRHAHVDEIARLTAKLERDPVVLRPWAGRGGPGEYDCPLVIVPRGRLRRVALQAHAGCHLVSVNGSRVNHRVGERVEVDAKRFRRGLNWVRVACPDLRVSAATAWLELEGSPTPPVPRGVVAARESERGPGRSPGEIPRSSSPVSGELARYDELRCILSGDARDPIREANRFVEQVVAPDEPLMAAVGKALIELNNEAVWNRRFDLEHPGLMIGVEDPSWVEPDTLALAVRMLETVQQALTRWPDRQVLWSSLGWLLRRARQPEAARLALVEALRQYPEAHWSWLELAQLERKLGEVEPVRLVGPADGLECAMASAEYYDWAARFFASAAPGRPPKVWSTFLKYVARRRSQLPGVVAKARDALQASPGRAGLPARAKASGVEGEALGQYGSARPESGAGR